MTADNDLIPEVQGHQQFVCINHSVVICNIEMYDLKPSMETFFEWVELSMY